jgi:ATP-dependent Lon protease
LEGPKTPLSFAANTQILLVAQRDAKVAAPSPADMYQVGTLGVIVQRDRLPDGTVRVVVEGKKRARVARYVFDQKFFKAEVEEIAEPEGRFAGVETLIRSVLSAFDNYAHRDATISPETASSIEAIDDPSILSDKIARHLNVQLTEQQALLESVSPVERLEKILAYLQAAN